MTPANVTTEVSNSTKWTRLVLLQGPNRFRGQEPSGFPEATGRGGAEEEELSVSGQ